MFLSNKLVALVFLFPLSFHTPTDTRDMNFKDSLKVLLMHEGGYVNHPSDPGGETNYGITKRTAIAFGYEGSMKDIPMSLVETIYKKAYWDEIKADLLPDEVRHHVFDAAVNSGPIRAVKWLQQAVGVEADGFIGQRTINAINALPAQNVVKKFSSLRLKYLTSLPTFPTFGKGWVNRVASYLGG